MMKLYSKTSQVVIDLGILSVSLWLAFLIRFDWFVPFRMFKLQLFVWPYILLLQYGCLMAFGVPKFSWRYVSLREVVKILYALSVAAVILIFLRILSAMVMDVFPYARYSLVPLGIIFINYFLAFLGITGVRVVRRRVAEQKSSLAHHDPTVHSLPTMLIGAGEAGVMVAKEIAARPNLGIEPIGFIDDDPQKQGSLIYGLKVLGTTNDLESLCEKYNAQQVLISMANVPGQVVRAIRKQCEKLGIPTKIIPGVYEIVGGKVNLTRIRDVAIEDLLGREPVNLDEQGIASVVSNEIVLVTGAGGSIGSELCRQICRFKPKQLLILDQAETSLFYIEQELCKSYPNSSIIPIIVDICEKDDLENVFNKFHPQVIFHAAAYKHVPMMEANPVQAIKNNVWGTQILAKLTDEYKVKEFVMISTDKAVNPTSVMGASKRLAEMYIQALSQKSKTNFVAVRFGNVLGSAGSVIPIFKEQIKKGGPVTITHRDMKRYFMTIPEACQLVLQAASMGKGGEIFILDMGQPVKIIDLARDLIHLSGFTPDEDIEIEEIGVRPGEKLFEELAMHEESANKTKHPKVFIGQLQPVEFDFIDTSIRQLDVSNPSEIISQLKELVPEYKPTF